MDRGWSPYNEETLKAAIADLALESPVYREYAVYRLGRQIAYFPAGSENSDRAMAAVIECLNTDADEGVRAACARALAGLDHGARGSDWVIRGSQEDSSGEVRAACAGALHGIDDQRAHRALSESALHDASHRVRFAALLGLSCARSLDWVSVYVSAVRDPSAEVVKVACKFLDDCQDEASRLALVGALGHETWEVRRIAACSLIRRRQVDVGVVECLERLAQEPEAARHDEMIELFDRIETELARDPDDESDLPIGYGRMSVLIAQARELLAGADEPLGETV